MQKNRDGEIARMQLLNQRLHGSENRLTSEEVKAVCSYLQGLTQIQQLVGNDAQALYKLVGHSSVVDAKRKSTSPKVGSNGLAWWWVDGGRGGHMYVRFVECYCSCSSRIDRQVCG